MCVLPYKILSILIHIVWNIYLVKLDISLSFLWWIPDGAKALNHNKMDPKKRSHLHHIS